MIVSFGGNCIDPRPLTESPRKVRLRGLFLTIVMIKFAKEVFLCANGIARIRGRSKEFAFALLAASHGGNLALIPQDDEVALCHDGLPETLHAGTNLRNGGSYIKMAGHIPPIVFGSRLIRVCRMEHSSQVPQVYIVPSSGRLLTLPEFARRNRETEHPTRVISHSLRNCCVQAIALIDRIGQRRTRFTDWIKPRSAAIRQADDSTCCVHAR
jgi:hypothetical protein